MCETLLQTLEYSQIFDNENVVMVGVLNKADS